MGPAVSRPPAVTLPDRIAPTIGIADFSVETAKLDAIVADAARETLDNPSLSVDQDGDGWVYSADDDIVPSADLSDAVIAAHDQRVTVLRSRMTALCTNAGAAASTLAMLYNRLQRAEAARWLALSRASGLHSSDRFTTGDNLDCSVSRVESGERNRDARVIRPTPAMIVRWATVRPMSGQDRWRSRQRAGAGSVSLRYVASVSSPSRTRRRAATVGFYTNGPQGSIRLAAVSHSLVEAITIGYSRNSPRIRHSIDLNTATRLARARRSLATARRALESGGRALTSISTPVSATRLTVVLPGLWRWDGSEKWSLVPNHATAG